MRSLEEFVHFENLLLFKKQLGDPRTLETRRRQLLRLLPEEEVKVVPAENNIRGRQAEAR